MKHFIVEITYLASVEQLGETVTEHRAYLQTGYDAGLLLFSGPLEPRTGGLVAGRAGSLEELEAFFRSDPYQKKGLATYRFVEFTPVKFQELLRDWVEGR